MPYPVYPLDTILYLNTQKTGVNRHFFGISGIEIAPAYIKSMPKIMPETNLTSRIRYAISGISIRCYLYSNTS